MRKWTLRMVCAYEGAKNHIATMQVSMLGEDGAWKPLEINNHSPGFLVFVYSLLTCQHLYMYVNAAERELELSGSEGELVLEATEGWMLTNLRVGFVATLRSGVPTPEKTEEIRQRMNQCPVSRNIHPSGLHETALRFAA